jgi:phosphatidylserine/phosphatidylglycerophosphate/cardiolipin synthase-like enzyme
MGLSLGGDFYKDFLSVRLPRANRSIWIATADIKNLHVQSGRKFVPFLSVLSAALERGVRVRLIHAKEPGPRFRKDFDRFPLFRTSARFERALCPRVHMKAVILDGRTAYIGSANLTGAGMGAKSERKRNFEAGVVTEDRDLVKGIEKYFSEIFAGKHCGVCALRRVCPDPIA